MCRNRNIVRYFRLEKSTEIINFPVFSNDDMYGHDKKFIAEVYKITSTVVEEILKNLQTLSGAEVSFNCANV